MQQSDRGTIEEHFWRLPAVNRTILRDKVTNKPTDGRAYHTCCAQTRHTHRSSSSSRMRVIYHNWSATKQRPHPQSVAEISRHSLLSGDRIRQCETSSLTIKEDARNFYRAMRMHKRGICCHPVSVRTSVRPSVCHVRELRQNE